VVLVTAGFNPLTVAGGLDTRLQRRPGESARVQRDGDSRAGTSDTGREREGLSCLCGLFLVCSKSPLRQWHIIQRSQLVFRQHIKPALNFLPMLLTHSLANSGVPVFLNGLGFWATLIFLLISVRRANSKIAGFGTF
jgi:hypothetical protein